MRPVKSYIAKRFQNSDAGLSLDTDALARYSDIIDLSIGDTDFITDDAIIDTAFRDETGRIPSSGRSRAERDQGGETIFQPVDDSHADLIRPSF